jgi:hypothetical protein
MWFQRMSRPINARVRRCGPRRRLDVITAGRSQLRLQGTDGPCEWVDLKHDNIVNMYCHAAVGQIHQHPVQQVDKFLANVHFCYHGFVILPYIVPVVFIYYST